MDLNNNTNEAGEQPVNENPFKNRKFYIAFFVTLIILCAFPFLVSGGIHDWTIGVLLLCIPYAIAGLIIWIIMRKRNRAVALGVLLGGVTPFVAVFIVTGGCGLLPT